MLISCISTLSEGYNTVKLRDYPDKRHVSLTAPYGCAGVATTWPFFSDFSWLAYTSAGELACSARCLIPSNILRVIKNSIGSKKKPAILAVAVWDG